MRRRTIPYPEKVPGEAADLYLKDIRKYTPLSRQEEASVVAAARKGNRTALHHLITANLRFVVRVAGKYTGRGLPLAGLNNGAQKKRGAHTDPLPNRGNYL